MKKRALPSISLFATKIKQRTTMANADAKTKRSPLNPLRLNRKAKSLLVVTLIAVILVSVFAFIPRQAPDSDPQATVPPASPTPQTNTTATPSAPQGNALSDLSNWMNNVAQSITQMISRKPGIVESAPAMNATIWRQVAECAWAFYQPGTGVDPVTGLPWAGGVNYKAFTDWDLGSYIQAVIDAQKIGLIGTDGPWGSSARIDKILTFLENRELNSNHYPYWFYQNDGRVSHDLSDKATEVCYTADTGRLFVALNNVRTFNSSLSTRVDNFVLNTNGNRSNYAALVPGLKSESLTSTSIYSYLTIAGFASFSLM